MAAVVRRARAVRRRLGAVGAIAAALIAIACGENERPLPPPAELFAPTPTPSIAAAPAIPTTAAAGAGRSALDTPPSAAPAQDVPPPIAAKQVPAVAENAVNPAVEAPEPTLAQGRDAVQAVITALVRDCPRPGEAAQRCPKGLHPPAALVTVAAILVAPRGALPNPRITRTPEEAALLSDQLTHAARAADGDFFALMWRHSDDPGDGVYRLRADSAGRFAEPLVQRALALGVGEVDAVQSALGWHVLLRLEQGAVVPKRPAVDLCDGPCPLPGESAERCPRPLIEPVATAQADVEVQSILITSKQSAGAAHAARGVEEALSIAIATCHAARTVDADFDALRRQVSDDPGSGRYIVGPHSALAPPFQRMARTMPVGSVGVVETIFGLHVIARLR